MDTKTQKILPLEKCTNIYKLVISIDVERKIRHLCNKISQVEWSGTLFYTYNGSYEKGDLEIKCVDIFPMDIGSSAYTEFDMSPDVIAYMTDHPELLDCQIGLVHSHNVMTTFFSSTDIDTLRKEGNDRNHFVSLIVNNAGTYTAAITRKIVEKRIINSTFTYKSFNDVEKTGTRVSEEEMEIISYNMLDIVKEGEVIESFTEIDERLEAIRRNKAKINSTKNLFSTAFNSDNLFSKFSHQEDKEITKMATLFDEEPVEKKPSKKVEQIIDPNEIVINPTTVKSIVLQLITGSIAITDTSRIDPMKWANQMTQLFDKRFNKDMTLFDLWAETIIEFIVTNSVPDDFTLIDETYISELCYEIHVALEKLPQNKYIKSLQNTLLLWMK